MQSAMQFAVPLASAMGLPLLWWLNARSHDRRARDFAEDVIDTLKRDTELRRQRTAQRRDLTERARHRLESLRYENRRLRLENRALREDLERLLENMHA